MRPGHIRVFDGLRVTPEHIEHFQGSLHLAVRDLRQIAGLGRVHRGFAVTAAGSEMVQLEPGLAFDMTGESLVLDEPRTVDLDWSADQPSLYLSLQYEPVEEGEQEGRFTLVFDSVRTVQSAELPQPGDNAVTIARLDRDEQAESSYRVTDLRSSQAKEQTTGAPEPTEDDSAPDSTSTDQAAVAETNADDLVSAEVPVEAPAPTAVESAGAPKPVWDVQQGVLRLLTDPTGPSVGAVLADALRDRLATGGPSEHAQITIPIASHRIPVVLKIRSLTSHGRLRVSWMAGGGQPVESPAAEGRAEEAANVAVVTEEPSEPTDVTADADAAPTLLPRSYTVEALVSGEATISPDAIAQFAAVHIVHASYEGAVPPAAAIVENRLALWPLSDQTTGENATQVPSWPPSLSLDFRLERDDRSDLALVTRAVWSGPIQQQSISNLRQRFRMTWQLTLAWKGQGMPVNRLPTSTLYTERNKP